MAQLVLTNAFVSVNGVDLSDHIRTVTLNWKAEIHDKTAMSATARARIGGLKDWDVRLDIYQDYAGGETDASLFDDVGSSVAIIIRPDAGAQSPTNPEFTGNGVVQDYQPVAGTVGEVAMTSVTILGDGTLARDAS